MPFAEDSKQKMDAPRWESVGMFVPLRAECDFVHIGYPQEVPTPSCP